MTTTAPVQGITELGEVAVLPKHKDVDTVVRLVRVDGEVYVDIRDRVEVDGEQVWGRGYLLPASLAFQASVALGEAGDAHEGVA